MPGLTQYLFETTLCLAVFYGFYHFFLRNNFLTNWNRWYLLTTPILALTIPGLDFIAFLQDFFYASQTEDILIGQSPEFNLAITDKLEENTPPFQLKFNDLLKSLYLFGVAILGFRFIDKLWKWVSIFQNQKPDWYAEYSSEYPNENFPNTSLFSFLFWNKKPLSEFLRSQLYHRNIKLNWKHSADVILMNVLVIAMWFHPLIFPFKRELQKWHGSKLIAHLNTENLNFTPFKNILWSSLPLALLLTLFSFNIGENLHGFQKINNTLTYLEEQSNFVLFKYEKEKPPAYLLKWGKLIIPLKNVAAPNGFSGEIELELSEFKTVFDSSLQVFKDTEKQVFQTLDLEIVKVESKRRIWIPNQNPDSIDLVPRWQRSKPIEIEKGDQLSITGKVGDIFLANVDINIKDPFKLYEPEIKVPVINQNKPSFEFQVINLPNNKSKIRIDTLNDKTQHIFELYGDENKYEVIHIPDFKTNERLIPIENILYPNIDDEKLIEPTVKDIFQLPDYQGYYDKFTRLFWGKMIAAPISKNYEKSFFQSNYRNQIRLKVRDEYLDIVSFRMIIVPSEGHPSSFFTDLETMDALDYDLKNIPPNSSIYFEKIILKVDETLMRLPISFMFNVGSGEIDYKLAITESQPGVSKDARRDKGYLYYQNYSLSELSRLLSGDERLVFAPEFNQPRLDVLFQSSTLPTRKGEHMILEKLREQFSYPVDLRYDSRVVYIIQSPKEPSRLEPYEYFYKIRPNLDKVLSDNNAKGLETITPGFFDDLAQLIEDRFGVYVLNESQVEKAYALGLDLSSFDALRKQLEQDFGIELLEEKRTIRTFNVREN